MGRSGTSAVLQQDKEQFTVSQNPVTSGNKGRNSRHTQCSTFALHHWPLLVALISVAGAAIGLRLGVGLNVSRSAPRGIYRAVGEAPTRGAPRGGLPARRGYAAWTRARVPRSW